MMTRRNALSTADIATWRAYGYDIRQLPTPTPFHLLQLPIVRMQRRLAQVNRPGGIAAQAAWERFHTIQGADRSHYAARIIGDPRLQLPIQGDAPILMAVLGLFDEQGWTERKLIAPPLRRLTQLMGVDDGGSTLQRVKEGLSRLALTRVLTARMKKGDDPRRLLQDVPVPPTEPFSAAVQEPPTHEQLAQELASAPVGAVHSLLDVTWGEEGIASISLGSAWLPNGSNQPAAQIDFGAYFAIKNPLARRLYELLCTAFVHEPTGPWEPSFAWLRAAAGYDPEVKPHRVVRELETAGVELAKVGLILDLCFAPTSTQPEFVSITPSSLMGPNRLLAGAPLTALPDERTLIAMLKSHRFTTEEAVEVVSGDLERVREAVCYLEYRKQQQSKKYSPISFPKAWLQKVLTDGTRIDQADFHTWYRGLIESAMQVRPAVSISGQVIGDTTPAPVVEDRRIDIRGRQTLADRVSLDNADAMEIWRSTLRSMTTEVMSLKWVLNESLLTQESVALCVDGDALMVGVQTQLYADVLNKPDAQKTLSDAVSRATDGKVRSVSVRVISVSDTGAIDGE